MVKRTTFIATGDAFITRRLPEGGYDGFEEIRNIIRAHDVKFSNLEMTFHYQEGYPAAFSGGTWAMADPCTLDDMKSFGFNLYNTANNHSADYSHGGILATINYLKQKGMLFSGTGRNLSEASKPCYLETKTARIALVSASSSFHESAMAGGQSADMQGRPGLNPLRFQKTYYVDEVHYGMVKSLAATTKMNASREYSIKNGYSSPFPEGTMPLGDSMFVLAEQNRIESSPNETDMARIEEEIKEAKRQADIVLVSLHAHETDTEDTTAPAQFIQKSARRCIEAGASAIIGHGPHELRGIEFYGRGVIFYSLGNFLFETETVELQPYDAYLNKRMSLDTKVGAYMNSRSKNGTAGYGVLENIWRSVMAAWTMEDGKIVQIQLYPISLGMEAPRSQKGIPCLAHNEQVLEYLQGLCRPYNTNIYIKNNIGYIDCQP